MSKDQLWKLKRYYEKVISDYYSTDEIDPDVANRIVGGLTKFMNIAEQQQQEIEQLNNLVKIKESHEQQANNMVHLLEQQLQQAQAKAERYKNHLLCIQRHYGLPSEPTDFVPVTVLHEIQMIVSNALEG